MNVIYGIILFILSLVYGPEGTAQIPVESGIATEKVKLAHKYHGILHSIEDETGFYFYRKGKRCKLFTDTFLKYEKRRK